MSIGKSASKKLSFLIAGVQKGATSALHYFLRQHPELCLPAKKELHFFDNEMIDWSAPPYDEAYHNHFHDVPAGALWGEATPIYSYWQPSAGRIQSYNPQIKLIILFRDPIARAYSHWRMETVRKVETLSFSQAIREGRERVISNAEIPGYHRVYSYVERGFYAEQIVHILSYFPREQIMYLTSYDLLHQQEKVLKQVCDFLGIGKFRDIPKQQLIFSHKNISTVSLAPNPRDIEYLRALFQEDLEQTQKLLGCKIKPEFV